MSPILNYYYCNEVEANWIKHEIQSAQFNIQNFLALSLKSLGVTMLRKECNLQEFIMKDS